MTEYHVQHEGTRPAGSGDGMWNGPLLVVNDAAGERLFVAHVTADNGAAIKATYEVAGPALSDDGRNALVHDALVRYGVIRLEAGLAAGVFPTSYTTEWQTIAVTADNLLLFVRLMGAPKKCDYQRVDGRDYLCTAALPTDRFIIGSEGLRSIAATSPDLCRRCHLPDADLMCSALLNPRVRLDSKDGAARRMAGGLCARGHDELMRTKGSRLCRAGGHECWTRTVRVGAEVAPGEVAHPLALHEALDFLDATWRLAFDARLLGQPAIANVAELAIPVSSREEFRSRLSSLGDVLNAMSVDSLLDEEAKRGKGSLARMEVALASRLVDDGAEVADAIGMLQAVMRLRAGLQHSDAATELPGRFAFLGIPYPPLDWAAAWNAVQHRVLDALRTLRDEVRRVADGRTPE